MRWAGKCKLLQFQDEMQYHRVLWDYYGTGLFSIHDDLQGWAIGWRRLTFTSRAKISSSIDLEPWSTRISDPRVIPPSSTSRPKPQFYNIGVFSRRFDIIRIHLRCGLQWKGVFYHWELILPYSELNMWILLGLRTVNMCGLICAVDIILSIEVLSKPETWTSYRYEGSEC